MRRFLLMPAGGYRVTALFLGLFLTPGCLPESGAPDLACLDDGQARAAELQGQPVLLKGDHAVGGAGDVILQNSRAAFIIQGVDRGISYYHYGGNVVDAVPLSDCIQAADDQLDELDFLVGRLDLGNPFQSILRAFRATDIEIVDRGGRQRPAIVRVYGTDDFYWLIEYTLIAMAVEDGAVRPLSQPLGIDWEIDYILPPDRPVLEIVYRLINRAGSPQEFMAANLLILGDRTDAFRMSATTLDFGGFSFLTGMPWLAAQRRDGPGAYAFTISDANMAGATIAGVEATFDLDQAIADPIRLAPGESFEQRYLFAVGERDAHSAVRWIAARDDALPTDYRTTTDPVSIRVVEAGSGEPVSDVVVDLELWFDERWQILDRLRPDAEGWLPADLPKMVNQNGNRRLVAWSAARGRSVPVSWTTAAPATVPVPRAGALHVRINDESGAAMPARLQLWQDDERVMQVFLTGEQTLGVAPGTYELHANHGFEYSITSATVTVPPGGTAQFEATLRHIVDTTGWMSIDTHVHSAPSADSKVLVDERIRNAAAVGLEVPVATDHEAIIGLWQGIVATGLHEWVTTITGEEVTASLPEHLTMFPAEPDGSLRGGIVRWYRKGLPELWDALHERSNGGVAMLNHPKRIYRLLEWDRIAGAAGIDDYSVLQLTESQAPWSWNFEGVELMNGYGTIYRQPEDHPSIGHFDNWMSFHNHGHRIVGGGASDAHGTNDLGEPRSYFRSPTDRPDQFRAQMAVDAYKQGQVLVSGGAFIRVLGANGQVVELGQLVEDDDGVIDLALDISAIPQIDVSHVRVYANCDEVRLFETTATDATVKFSGTVTVPVSRDGTVRDAHIVVAAFGSNPMPRGFQDYDPKAVPRAITNPLYVDTNGNGVFDPPGGKECVYSLD